MGRRPPGTRPPDYLSKNPPLPESAPVKDEADPLGQDPTRYGDWELKGIAVDF